MSRTKLAVDTLEVETFPAEPDARVMMRPPYETHIDDFTCAMVGCTYEAPCV